MFSYTLVMQQLKSAAWLHMNEDSLADLSNFLRVSCEIDRKVGGVEVRPEALAILM